MRKKNEDFSFKELVNIFLPKLWLIVAISLVFGSVMAFYSLFVKDDTYTSSTTIHVVKTTDSRDMVASDFEFASSYIETYVEVLRMPKFLTAVLEEFKANHEKYERYEGQYENENWDDLVYSNIRGAISSSTKQDLLTVSVTTGNPSLSYGIANSIAAVFEDENQKFLAYPDDAVNEVAVVTPDHHPAANSRKVVLNTLIGFVAGAVIAMALVFVINMYDVVIHDKKKIEDHFDVPILGVIPRFITDEGKVKNEKEN